MPRFALGELLVAIARTPRPRARNVRGARRHRRPFSSAARLELRRAVGRQCCSEGFVRQILCASQHPQNLGSAVRVLHDDPPSFRLVFENDIEKRESSPEDLRSARCLTHLLELLESFVNRRWKIKANSVFLLFFSHFTFEASNASPKKTSPVAPTAARIQCDAPA